MKSYFESNVRYKWFNTTKMETRKLEMLTYRNVNAAAVGFTNLNFNTCRN